MLGPALAELMRIAPAAAQDPSLMNGAPTHDDSRPVRVLMLATRVPVEPGDGSPSFVLDGAMALPEAAAVTIVAPRVKGSPPIHRHGSVIVRRFGYPSRRRGALSDDAIMPQLARHPVRWWQAVALSVAMLMAAVGAHRRTRPHLVHAQWIVPAGLVALILRAMFGTPYVVTSRGADAFTMQNRLIEHLRRLIIRRSQVFLAVSGEILRRFAGIAPQSDHLPSGVDFDAWNARVGERVPQPGRILFVGRLTAKKGVDVLLHAVAEVEGAWLRIAGDGPSRDSLQRLVEELGIGERVAFLGRCDRGRLAEEYRTASCVAISSVISNDGDREGTPNVLGEAVASGVPVIASATGGIVDLIAHDVHGLLVRPGDPAALAAALRRILDDEELGARMARSARSTLRGRLDLHEIAGRQMDWYARVADGS